MVMDLIKKRVEIFLKDNIPAHIVSKENSWFNGYVLEIFEEHFFFLDRVEGKVPIFFVDVRIFDFFEGDFRTLKKPDGVE